MKLSADGKYFPKGKPPLGKYVKPELIIHYRLRRDIYGNNVSMLDKKSILRNKKSLESRKEMTSKKAKVNDLKIITNFDYRTKEVKKKNQYNKRIETFFPVSNGEGTKK